MNEKIRQLMIKAICVLDDNADPNDRALQKELKRMYIPNVFSEKFTSLILQECFWIMSKKANQMELDKQKEQADNLRLVIKSIQEHFDLR